MVSGCWLLRLLCRSGTILKPICSRAHAWMEILLDDEHRSGTNNDGTTEGGQAKSKNCLAILYILDARGHDSTKATYTNQTWV